MSQWIRGAWRKPWAWITFLVLWVSLGSLPAQPVTDAAEISLLTCSPGRQLYTTFGHSAIRLRDTLTGVDLVFNYGTFDFDTPNFYWKFLRGKLLYKLSVQKMDQFLHEYRYENRRVVEQPLLLSPEEKQAVIWALQINYLPENRYYLYDFFFDNCATRIRDVLESQIGESVIHEKDRNRRITFRQMLHQYLGRKSWAAFGIDLLLGLPADRQALSRDQMFLPDYLAANFISGSPGGRTLLGEEKLLVPDNPMLSSAGFSITPIAFFALLAAITLALLFLPNRSRWKRGFDFVLLLVLGLVGLFLLFMWLGTDHKATAVNLNLLWANPLYLLFLAGLGKSSWRFEKNFFLGLAFLSGLLLVNWWWWPQQYHPAVLPVLALLLIRSVDRLRTGRTAKTMEQATIEP